MLMSDKLSFKPFDENGEVRIYYNGLLPHWRQAGCTYFVTFRLADSVPQGVLEEWIYERDRWLVARGIDPNVIGWREAIRSLSRNDIQIFERDFTGRLFTYLDKGYGACHLRGARVGKIVSDALKFFHGTRLETGDFVVMPNHVHALMTPFDGFELENILHSIKSYTSSWINRHLGRSGTLWMEESHDHIVRDAEELLRIQGYIARNPQKANLEQTHYQYQEADYQQV
jgi:type I restriction enzyme R subunit